MALNIDRNKDPILYGEDITSETPVKLIGYSKGQPIYQSDPVSSDLGGGGIWRMSGSGAGYTGETTRDVTITTSPQTVTSRFVPTREMPVIGGAATANIPEYPDVPEYAEPELEQAPIYTAPEWDRARIEELARISASPILRKAGQGLRDIILSQRYEQNPAVRGRTLREALSGYGVAVSEAVATGHEMGVSEYTMEYAVKAEEAKIQHEDAVNFINQVNTSKIHAADMNFSAELQKVKDVFGAKVAAEVQSVADENLFTRTVFEASLQDYFATGETIQTTSGGEEKRTYTTGGTGTPSGTGYNARVYAAKKAAVDRMAWNDPLRQKALAELEAMRG